MEPNINNLRVWDALERTDPAHTKQFNRPGGFKGTAIKPIYSERRMTEAFGPCGIGWGFTEPTFQLVNAADGEVAVYCWLSLWIEEGGKRSELIPGVGGDMVVKKLKDGRLIVDDEAFKKAATDAQSNAMKHLGMSADVHMGRFDDQKYVAELRREIADCAKAEETPFDPPKANGHAPAAYTPPKIPVEPAADGANWIGFCTALDTEASKLERLEDLTALWKANDLAIRNCKQNAPQWHTNLVERFGEHKNRIRSMYP